MPRPDRLLNRRNDSVHHLTRYLGQLLFKRFVFAPFVVCRGKANRATSALDGSPCPTLGCKPGGIPHTSFDVFTRANSHSITLRCD